MKKIAVINRALQKYYRQLVAYHISRPTSIMKLFAFLHVFVYVIFLIALKAGVVQGQVSQGGKKKSHSPRLVLLVVLESYRVHDLRTDGGEENETIASLSFTVADCEMRR